MTAIKEEVNIGNIRLLRGDCLEIMPELIEEGIKVDMILSDPPYGIDFLSNWTDNHRKINNDDLKTWQETLPLWFEQFKNIISDTGVLCCCGGGGGKTPSSAIFTMEMINYFNLINTIIWDKKTIGLGWRYRPSYETIVIGSKSKDKYNWFTERADISNIYRCNNIIPQKGDHPTPKPIQLMQHFLFLHTQENMLVLEPFLGSGTTAVACYNTDRKCIGIEIDKEYFDIAVKRVTEASRQGRLDL